MYQFIPRDELQSVLDIANFPESGRDEIAYQYFVNDRQEALYIEENGVMLGMISIGDLERYYAGRKDKLEINSHFSYTDKIDEEKAAAFWERFKTFFEFPVVNNDGRLEGVMKRDIHYIVRQDQIASLVCSKYLKDQWHRRELKRFLNSTKARTILYYMEEVVIVKEIAGRRRFNFGKEDEEIYWEGLSKGQWGELLGESNAVMGLRRELGNCRTEMVKGISEIVSMEGEFYHFVDGNRVTLGNPENQEQRIIFYGPCTICGVYGRDSQTIESCFQRMLNLQMKAQIQVINKGLLNMCNYFSRLMTDELSERDVVVVYVEKNWLTEEIVQKCAYVGDLTNTFLSVENLENNIVDNPGHCNYRVNERLAQQIYQDFEEHNLFDVGGLSDRAERIQDYYIGSEIMSEVLLYMEHNGLLKGDDVGIKGAMALLADPFTDRHRRAVEMALQKVDKLYLFISEDSNLKFTLEERVRLAKEALKDLKEHIVVVPAGKYLYTKKISRGIRKQKFCDDDMEYDCDIFGEVFGKFMGLSYRFVLSELDNPVERKYMDTCISILPRFGVAVEEL